MLIIRESQLAALGEHARDQFEELAYRHLRAVRGEKVLELGEPATRALVKTGVTKALSHAIDDRLDVLAFLEILVDRGIDFDQSPSYPWASTILNMRNPGVLKIQQLQFRFKKADSA